jgi:glycosyltransferase involved in cell wall biosynthesis
MMINRSYRERLFRIEVVKRSVTAALVLRGLLRLLLGNTYRGMNDLCRVVRISHGGWLHAMAASAVQRFLDRLHRTGRNILVDAYLSSSASSYYAGLYSIAGTGTRDIFRDLIVLAPASADQKGVVLFKYTRTFDAVVALFDLSRLMERYIIVLEPSWVGYCDPSILMFLSNGNPVFVQCFTDEDRQFVAKLCPPLVPVPLGPADWADVHLFTPGQVVVRRYDLVMVANWALHKRHATLFRALAKIREREIRVLLIGFPWAGRTADDIRREAASMKNENVHIDIVENLPQTEVAACLTQCKVFVFLSRKEGDNKALVEAMLAGVPVIVYDDEQLPEKILYMLDHCDEFTPRSWALEHTGSETATRILNEVIRRTVAEAGGRYSRTIVEKTNSPNLTYKDPGVRRKFDSDYQFILTCRRGASTASVDTQIRPSMDT